MYIHIENNEIKLVGKLPSVHNGIFNFPAAPIETIENEGFYPFIENEITEGKMNGQIYFDAENKVGRQELIDIPKPQVIWHEPSKPIQLEISNELKKDWILKDAENKILGNYPEISALLEYVKNLTAPRTQDENNLFIYLEEIYPDHETFLRANGVKINLLSDNTIQFIFI